MISKPIRGALVNKGYPLSPDTLCLPFNELSGDYLFDLTGNLHHGAVNGTLVWRDGLTFNGSESNFVSIPILAAFIAGTKNFTIIIETIWGSSSVDEALIDISDTISSSWYQNSLMLFGDNVGASRNDVVNFLVGNNGTLYRIESAAGVKAAGAKTHIVITFDAPIMRMYINGIEDANSPITGPSLMDTGLIDDAWVGKSHAASGSQKPHQGSINYLYIDSRAYSAAEVLQSYVAPYQIFDTGLNPAIFGSLVAATGRLSRYHSLDGLGGFGQQTFNPLR